MALSTPTTRREVHHRLVDMHVFARADGLYDVEARLVDRKPFPFVRPSSSVPVPGGQALHDLWIRLTVASDFEVRGVEASSDITPWSLCKEAEATLQALVGERIARGWSSIVKRRLIGAASCTHLVGMLLTMGTAALQGIYGSDPTRRPGLDLKLDSCYAYGRQRAVVKMLWPEHYQDPDAS